LHCGAENAKSPERLIMQCQPVLSLSGAYLWGKPLFPAIALVLGLEKNAFLTGSYG
jgi:hypothetical protein